MGHAKYTDSDYASESHKDGIRLGTAHCSDVGALCVRMEGTFIAAEDTYYV